MTNGRPNPADLYQIPCPMCGEGLRLQRIDFNQTVGCPHCGESTILRLKNAELLSGFEGESNLVRPVQKVRDEQPEGDGMEGTTSVRRYLASLVDHGFAFAAAIFVVKAFPVSWSDMALGVLSVVFFFMFFLVCEGISARTPGKAMFGLRVINAEGKKPSWKQIFIRTVWRIFEVNPILLGALPACLIIYATQSHQRIGDLLGKTFVIFD